MDDVTRQAFATACGVLAAIFVVLTMGLQEPFWAALSAIVIANVDREALFTKAVLRAAGTVAGVVAGYHAGQWTEGLPLQQAALVALAAGAGAYGRNRSAYGYAWFYGTITFMLIMLYTMTEPQNLYAFAHYRCYEIVAGVVCGTLSSWAFAPRAEGLHARLAAQRVTATPETAFHQALVAALGALVIIACWALFDLPQLPQVLASSLVVLDIDPMATRHRGAQRILGCIVGGVAGLLVVAADATDIVWWTAMVFLGVFLFARVHLEKSSRAYVGTQSAIAYVVTLVGSGPPQTLAPPLDRLVGIMIGVSIMTVLVWALAGRSAAATADAPVRSGSDVKARGT